MEKKDVRVTCPCCHSRIEVDVRTGHVLRWRRPEEVDETGKPKVKEEDWDEATGRVSGRLAEARDRFEAGLAKEKSRAEELEELFRKAKAKLEKPADEG